MTPSDPRRLCVDGRMVLFDQFDLGHRLYSRETIETVDLLLPDRISAEVAALNGANR